MMMVICDCGSQPLPSPLTALATDSTDYYTDYIVGLELQPKL